ncbi:MAG: NAD(+) synthase, partial [Caldisericaceae bacterium]
MLKDNLIIPEPEKIVQRTTEFIKENVKNFGRDGAILGISGGIDSAVSAYIAVGALGKENVIGLFLGERDS